LCAELLNKNMKMCKILMCWSRNSHYPGVTTGISWNIRRKISFYRNSSATWELKRLIVSKIS